MKKYMMIMSLAAATVAASAQSVTVGASGADYTSINAAIVAVGSNPTAPDIITIMDEGPFLESRIILNAGVAGPADMTIQGAPGIRPRVVINNTGASANSAVYIRKTGNIIVRDLIVMPTTDFTEATFTTAVGQAGIEIDDDAGVPTSVTLHNILVTSNDGNNQPVASLDGLTSPTFTANTVSFRDEGIQTLSAATDATRNVYMYDVIVSGVAGDQGSDGIRGFIDGAAGSEWVIGPGCVVSYCNHNEGPVTSGTFRAALQPGGTAGLDVRIEGSQDKPVKFINNNLNGIAVTNTPDINEGFSSAKWLIVANNSGTGFTSVDTNSPVSFENVTFANNEDGVLAAPSEPDALQYTFSNVIAAGNGIPTDPENNINLIAYGSLIGFGSTFTATNSAIVLNGPYTLNNVDYGADGINSDINWTVIKTNVIASDPQFLSLDPTDGSFAVVSNQAYGTAGPGGQPLVGGGTFAPSSVSDWQLF